MKNFFWYNRYKYYRNTPNSLITKSKRSYLRKFSQENNTTDKDVCTKINEIIHNRNHCYLRISENGTLLTNQKTVSNTVNQCFIDIAKTLMGSIGKATAFKTPLKTQVIVY